MDRTRERQENWGKITRCSMLLDEKVPGWRERIDKNTLDLSSNDSCVFGQVFGSYGIGARNLDLTDMVGNRTGERYGVHIKGNMYLPWMQNSTTKRYQRLTEDWIEYLDTGESSQKADELDKVLA